MNRAVWGDRRSWRWLLTRIAGLSGDAVWRRVRAARPLSGEDAERAVESFLGG